jgi:AcrR family transcriptional regulator
LAADPPATGRQRQAAETRQHLLSVACEVFDERGYLATSVGAITERAATAHGTFYLYFKNKEDAFCQVMETIIQGELAVSTVLPEGLDARDGIDHVIRGFVRAWRPRVGLWRAILEGMLQSARIRDIWLELRRMLVHGIAAVLESECRQGRTRPLDPLMTAYAMAAMTEWFLFMHFALDEPPATASVPGADQEQAVEVLVDLWHQAIYGRVSV